MTIKSEKSPVIFNAHDVEMLEQKPLYKGFLKLNQYRFRHRLFNGSMSDEITREIIERSNAVVVLAYDSKRDNVVLIEQIRIASIKNSKSPWLLELIAGMIETGESIEDVARRESQEEAGIVLGRCKSVLSYLTSPGGTTERLFIVVGEVDSTTAHGIHGLEEENEDIRVHVVSRDQAYAWVEEGVIDNGASVIAIQWLQLHYHALIKEWLI